MFQIPRKVFLIWSLSPVRILSDIFVRATSNSNNLGKTGLQLKLGLLGSSILQIKIDFFLLFPVEKVLFISATRHH